MLLKPDVSTALSFHVCCVQSSPRYLHKIWKSELSVLIYIEHLRLLFVHSEILISHCLPNKRHVELILSHPPFNSNF